MRWLDVGPRPAGSQSAWPVRAEGVDLLLIADDDGTLFAIDAQCPHEDRPLMDGMLRNGAWICPWHHWAFRLADGACIHGERDLRAMPVRIRSGRVEVAVPLDERATRLESLREAMAHPSVIEQQRAAHQLARDHGPPARLVSEWAFSVASLRRAPRRAAASYARWLTADEAASDDSWLPALTRWAAPDETPRTSSCSNVPPPTRRGVSLPQLRNACEAGDVPELVALYHGAVDGHVPPGTRASWLAHLASEARHAEPVVSLMELDDLARACETPVPTAHATSWLEALVAARVRRTPLRDVLDSRQVELDRLPPTPGRKPVDHDQVREAMRGAPGDAVEFVWTALADDARAVDVARGLLAATFERFDDVTDETSASHWGSLARSVSFGCAVWRLVQRHPGPPAVRLLLRWADALSAVKPAAPRPSRPDPRDTPSDSGWRTRLVHAAATAPFTHPLTRAAALEWAVNVVQATEVLHETRSSDVPRHAASRWHWTSLDEDAFLQGYEAT